jgi:hypothetical protein
MDDIEEAAASVVGDTGGEAVGVPERLDAIADRIETKTETTIDFDDETISVPARFDDPDAPTAEWRLDGRVRVSIEPEGG